MTFCFLYVTARDRDEALSIARTLVQERLVACANVLSGMTSVYEWEGELHEDSECVLILKTREELAPAARERVAALHSYEVPCILTLPVSDGNAAYLAWLEERTGQGNAPAS